MKPEKKDKTFRHNTPSYVYYLVIVAASLLGYFSYDIVLQLRPLFMDRFTPAPTIQVTPTPSLTPEQIKNDVINFTNQERAKISRKPLKENSLLNKSAQLKADDISDKGYWSHNTPEGFTPWKLFKQVGYNYLYAGENLGKDYERPESLVNGWMNSPEHKENILSPNFTEIGVGVRRGIGSLSSLVVVQHFGSPQRSATNEANKVPSRTGKIVSYHDWCNNKDITVYENEIIVKKSSDGKTYGMTVDDWKCYEDYLAKKR